MVLTIIYTPVVHSGHTIKIFLTGDYEFLCRMYGLSGASGKKQKEMKQKPTLIAYPRPALLLVVHCHLHPDPRAIVSEG